LAAATQRRCWRLKAPTAKPNKPSPFPPKLSRPSRPPSFCCLPSPLRWCRRLVGRQQGAGRPVCGGPSTPQSGYFRRVDQLPAGHRDTPDTEAPVNAPLHAAARTLQFVRSKAAEWNADKTCDGSAGDSTGACSRLWLAFHEDMATPDATGLVARESTSRKSTPRRTAPSKAGSTQSKHSRRLAALKRELEKTREDTALLDWMYSQGSFLQGAAQQQPGGPLVVTHQPDHIKRRAAAGMRPRPSPLPRSSLRGL
jgi:hypothetical protein